MHPPSYRYLSCQSSGWSSRFDAAATTPRRAVEIFALPLETAGLAARAAPGGARAANRGVADIAAGAVGIEIRARANRWPARARREMTLRCPRTRVALNIVDKLVCHRCHSDKITRLRIGAQLAFFYLGKQSLKTYNSVFPGKFGELRTLNRRRNTNFVLSNSLRIERASQTRAPSPESLSSRRDRRVDSSSCFPCGNIFFWKKDSHRSECEKRSSLERARASPDGRGGGGAGRGPPSTRYSDRDTAHPGAGRRAPRGLAR